VKRHIALAAVLAAAIGGPAAAIDTTWITAPSVIGDWNAGANWVGNIPPNGAADIARFNTQANASVTSATDIATLDLQAIAVGETVNIGVTSTMTVGTITNSSAGRFEITATGAAASFTLTGAPGSGTAFNGAEGGTINLNGVTLGANVVTASGSSPITVGRVEFQNGASAGTSLITITGNSIVDFTQNSTAANATVTVTGVAAEIRFADTATAGNAAITLNAGGSAVFTDSATAGSAVFTNNGGGVLFFFDTSAANATYIGGTGSTLQLDGVTSSLALGSLQGSGQVLLGDKNLTVGGLGTTTSFSGTIDGIDGSLTKVGGGTLTLSGVNTYTGATTVSNGTLALAGSGSIAASSSVTVAAGATFDISGTTAGTTVQDLGGAATSVVALGNGALTVQSTNATDFAGDIGGAGGSLIKQGGGTLTLSGTNSYGGGTTVTAGTLRLGSANALPAGGPLAVNGGLLDLNGNAASVGTLSGTGGSINNAGVTLTVTQATDGTYAGTLAGAGGLFSKTGPGTLTLTGNSNGYGGSSEVNGGALLVNGTLGGNATVNAGASLGGTGTIGGNVIVNGGTVAGSLTIGGSYGGTSTLQIAVAPGGQNDRVTVTGAATITGTTLSIVAQSGRYSPTTQYTILQANGGVTGPFVTITSNLASLTVIPTYTANAVILSLSSVAAFAANAQTANQRAVGTALDRANATAAGDFNSVLDVLFGLAPSQSAQAFDMIGGQAYSGFSTFAIQNAVAFMNAFTNQIGGGSGANRVALAEACEVVACDTARWGAWGGGVGSFGTVAGDANSRGLTYSLAGFVGGLDYRFNDGFLAGITAGYTSATLYAAQTPGQGSSGTVQVGLYGQFREGALYVDALAGYARSDNRMTRPIIIPGLYRVAQGATTADQLFGQLEGGYRIDLGFSQSFVTPFLRLQGSTVNQAGFGESGAGSLNLTVAQQTTNSLRTVLGAQLGAALDAGWRDRLNLALRFGWSHEYADTSRPVSASFAGAPAIGFTTFGAAAPRDGAVLGASATTKVADNASVYFRYDGELQGGNTSHTLSAGARIVW
jgi:outer membrane autotransporter protein